MKLNQKGFSLVEGLLIFIAISLVGFIGYYVYDKNSQNEPEQNNIISEQQKPAEEIKNEASKPPELIEYDPMVEIKKSEDAEKLVNASDSFKKFIADKISSSVNPDCPEGITISVNMIYKDEFARGGISGCGGAYLIWKKENGIWKQVSGGQAQIECKDVEKYKIPAKIAGGDTCYDYDAQKEKAINY